MPKKRNEPSPIEIVIASRWPVAATLAAVCFVAFLILPGILASSRFLFALAPLIRTIALIACLGFGVVSLFKFLREAGADRTAARVTSDLSAVRPARQRSRDRYPGASAPAEWSLALLQSIEWKRFEEVIAAYFRAKHFRCETIEYGSDGGVDGRLYFGDLPAPVGIVQCKAWGNRQVGVAPVRELLGVMAHDVLASGLNTVRSSAQARCGRRLHA